MPHPWYPTYLFYLLLVAVGTHTLKGLFSVICIPALLVIGLLGLKVRKGVLGAARPTWGPRVRLPMPRLPPCGGLWWKRHPSHEDLGTIFGALTPSVLSDVPTPCHFWTAQLTVWVTLMDDCE